MFLLKCIIDLFKWKKRKLFCLFVDYKKAFDMVWREGLWWKLVRDNVSGKLLKVIHSMYNNIMSCVMVNQEMSDTFMCYVGGETEKIYRHCYSPSTLKERRKAR